MLSSIGSGVVEIRLHQPNEYRVIYVANFAKAIYVLHVFEKKEQRTLKRHIESARIAYGEVKRLQ